MVGDFGNIIKLFGYGYIGHNKVGNCYIIHRFIYIYCYYNCSGWSKPKLGGYYNGVKYDLDQTVPGGCSLDLN